VCFIFIVHAAFVRRLIMMMIPPLMSKTTIRSTYTRRGRHRRTHVLHEHLIVIGLRVYITHCQNMTFYVYFICALCNSPPVRWCPLGSPRRKRNLDRGPDLQNILRHVLRLSYDNAKVTINVRRTSNLQNSLQ